MDSWNLSTTETGGTPLYLANGYLGTSIGWDGGVLLESEAFPCYVRGVYDTSGFNGVDRLAVLPCWGRVRYGAAAEVRRYRRRLDLRHAVLETTFTLEEKRGEVHLAQRVWISRADRHLAIVRLEIQPEFDGEITVLAGLEAPREGHFSIQEAADEGDSFWLCGHVEPYDIDIAEVLHLSHQGWRVSGRELTSQAVSRRLIAQGRAGFRHLITQAVRLVTSLESDSPLASARRFSNRVSRAEAAHRREWESLWKTDIEVEGDPEIQQFARAGLFYLWSTVHPGDEWSIAPMGLSSNGYSGHIFWDAEFWMYPSLLVTQPELAHACVAYRERTLDQARKRAASNGYRGAQFPWEGGFTGAEMTPHWADTRDFQLHITADVAIGQWWYFINTGSVDWLRKHGFPIIRECAEYWVSRVEYNEAMDRYEVSDVVCADEYAAHVNNNAFTNASVRKALLIAARAAAILGVPSPLEWRTIADKLYIPFDDERRVHLEYDSYAGQITKQADVELLAYPLEYVDDQQQVARDLAFYGTVIDPDGPAMSFSIYSILHAQLGRPNSALDFLRRSFVPNTRPPFWSFSETPINDEFFFCTGVGGALQALLFGFTGLRLREGFFALRPSLPDGWRLLRLPNLFINGARIDIELRRHQCLLRSRHDAGDVAVRVRLEDDRAESIGVTESRTDLQLDLLSANGNLISSHTVSVGQEVPLASHGGGIRVRLISERSTIMDVLLAPMS